MNTGDTIKIIGGKHQKKWEGHTGTILSNTSKFVQVKMSSTIKIRIAHKFIEVVPQAEVKPNADANVNPDTGEENPNFVYEEEWGKEDDGEELHKNNYPEWSEVEAWEKENEKLKQQLVKTQELLAKSINNDKMIKIENQKLKDLLQFYL